VLLLLLEVVVEETGSDIGAQPGVSSPKRISSRGSSIVGREILKESLAPEGLNPSP
jgi:hypothetical protein